MSKDSTPQLVLLLRSGRTAWDDEGRLQGRTDLPLSENGRTSFVAGIPHALGEDEPGFTVIHHGPDEASKESATLVSERIGAKLKQVKGFGGMDVGLWDGLLESELTERYPRAFKQWHDDPLHVTPPEGETIPELADRLLSALVKIVDKSGEKPIAVVLRPIAFSLLACLLAGKGTNGLWEMVQEGPSCERATVSLQQLRDMIESHRASV